MAFITIWNETPFALSLFAVQQYALENEAQAFRMRIQRNLPTRSAPSLLDHCYSARLQERYSGAGHVHP